MGVKAIPAKFDMTVLHNAVATFPPLAEVSNIHMLIVVGRHVNINSPSRIGNGSKFGTNFSMMEVSGYPIRNGHAANVMAWMEVFNFRLENALVNSVSLRLRPERRKIVVTPY
mmetsp:Transcript_11802/g.25377  ORF Transcript_11802/g.25377 Transcript_11802/m.25377 type:complete len:113 (+) Transcript_11802:749-1087(+)